MQEASALKTGGQGSNPGEPIKTFKRERQWHNNSLDN